MENRGIKFYNQVIVDENGEFIIPAELRKKLNVKPGDRFIVLAKPDEKAISLIPAHKTKIS